MWYRQVIAANSICQPVMSNSARMPNRYRDTIHWSEFGARCKKAEYDVKTDTQKLLRHKPSGILRLLGAFRYSFQGFQHAWKEEAAFRQDSALAFVLIPVGLYLGRGGAERALMVSSVLLILIVEILNSAIEAIVDRAGTSRHPLAGMAKDMGSAAVMMCFVLLGTVWLLILLDHANTH
jgi:diacylglycerol kinase (ATP)